MEHFVLWIKQITAWLYVPLYQNQLFFIDFWSLVHVWSGFTVIVSMYALKFKRTFPWLIFFLFTYELIEVLMVYFALDIFYPETLKDQITDIVVGLLGGLWAYQFLKFRIRGIGWVPAKISLEHILTSLSCAFVWTGNFSCFFSSPGLTLPFDWTGYVFMVAGCHLFLQTYIYWRNGGEERKSLPLNCLLVIPSIIFLTHNLWRAESCNQQDSMLYSVSVLLGLAVLLPGCLFMYRFFILIVQKALLQFQ
jgi:hypothetical protein